MEYVVIAYWSARKLPIGSLYSPVRAHIFRPAVPWSKMKHWLLFCAFFAVLSSLAYAQGLLGADR